MRTGEEDIFISSFISYRYNERITIHKGRGGVFATCPADVVVVVRTQEAQEMQLGDQSDHHQTQGKNLNRVGA